MDYDSVGRLAFLAADYTLVDVDYHIFIRGGNPPA